jgi:copper chaperone CopZ
MEKKTFEVPALYGDHHVTEVRRILLELKGVKEVYASSAFQTVEVIYDEKKISEREIGAKLKEAGYLGEWTVPVEAGTTAHPTDQGEKPYFRHTTVYETTKKTVTFAQRVNYSGRPLWPCPGMGTLSVTRDEEADHA